MGKQSIVGFSHIDASYTGVNYFPSGPTGSIPNAVYSDVIRTMKGSGSWKLKNSSVWCGALGKDTGLSIWHNNALSALEHTILGASDDDSFLTDSSEVTLAADDTICYRLSQSGGGGLNELRMANCELLTLTGPTIYILQTCGDMNITSSQSGYISVGGTFSALGSTEADIALRVRAPGRIRFLETILDATIVSGAVTVTLTKNGVDTALTTSVGTNQTAIDTTNSVRVASGDTISFHVVAGTLGATAQLEAVSVIIESDNDQSDIMAIGSKNYSGVTATHYTKCFGGDLSSMSTTDANNKMRMPFDTRIGRLRFYSDLTVTGSAVGTLRKNGSDTGHTVTVSAGAKGWREAAIGSYVDVSAGDELDVKFDATAFTGRIVMLAMTLNYDPITGMKPQVGIEC